jgi:hypothetical protein
MRTLLARFIGFPAFVRAAWTERCADRRAGGDLRLIRPQIKRLKENMEDGRFDAMKQELDLIGAPIDSKVGGKSNGGR